MKLIIILSSLSIVVNAQVYSNYYNINKKVDVNVSGSIDVNQKVNVTKTIKTIDYGQLALANAQKEKNRLEKLKYNSAVAQKKVLEIIDDPINAYKYGRTSYISYNKEECKKNGFKKDFFLKYKAPHDFLFESPYSNVLINKLDGITTKVYFNDPKHKKGNSNIDIEEYCNKLNVDLGTVHDSHILGNDKKYKVMYHKTDCKRGRVFKHDSFIQTISWEDKYEKGIMDVYRAKIKEGYGIYARVEVNYFGDKEDVTFEELEGRRYYLKPLIDKVISNTFYNGKLKY